MAAPSIFDCEWQRIAKGKTEFARDFKKFRAQFTSEEIESLSRAEMAKEAFAQYCQQQAQKADTTQPKEVPSNDKEKITKTGFTWKDLESADCTVYPYSPTSTAIRDTLDKIEDFYRRSNHLGTKESAEQLVKILANFYLEPEIFEIHSQELQKFINGSSSDCIHPKLQDIAKKFKQDLADNFEDDYYKISNTILDFLRMPSAMRIRKGMGFLLGGLGSGRDAEIYNVIRDLTELLNINDKDEHGNEIENKFVAEKMQAIYDLFAKNENKKLTLEQRRTILQQFLDLIYAIMDEINQNHWHHYDPEQPASQIPMDLDAANTKLRKLKKLANNFAEKYHFPKQYLNVEKEAIKNGKTHHDYQVQIPAGTEKFDEDLAYRVEGIKNTSRLFQGYKDKPEKLNFSKLWFGGFRTLGFTNYSRALYNIIHVLYSYDLLDELQELLKLLDENESGDDTDGEQDKAFARKLTRKLFALFNKIKNLNPVAIENISTSLAEKPLRNAHIRDQDDIAVYVLDPLQEYINEITQEFYGEKVNYIKPKPLPVYINIDKLNEDESKKQKIGLQANCIPHAPNADKRYQRRVKKGTSWFSSPLSFLVGLSEMFAVGVFGAQAVGVVFPPGAPAGFIMGAVGYLASSAFGANFFLVKMASDKGLQESILKPYKDAKGKPISRTKKRLLGLAVVLAIGSSAAYGFLSFFTATTSLAALVKVLAGLGILSSTVPGVGIFIAAGIIGFCLFVGVAFLFYRAYSDVIENDLLKDVKKWFSDRFYMKDFWRKLKTLESWKHLGKCLVYAIPVFLAVAITVIANIVTFGVFRHETIWALKTLLHATDKLVNGIIGIVGYVAAGLTTLANGLFGAVANTNLVFVIWDGAKSAIKSVCSFMRNPIRNTASAVKTFIDDPVYVFAKVLSKVASWTRWGVIIGNGSGYGASSFQAANPLYGCMGNAAAGYMGWAGAAPDSFSKSAPAAGKLFDPAIEYVKSFCTEGIVPKAKAAWEFLKHDYTLPPNDRRKPGKIAAHVLKCAFKAPIHLLAATVSTAIAAPFVVAWVGLKCIYLTAKQVVDLADAYVANADAKKAEQAKQKKMTKAQQTHTNIEVPAKKTKPSIRKNSLETVIRRIQNKYKDDLPSYEEATANDKLPSYEESMQLKCEEALKPINELKDTYQKVLDGERNAYGPLQFASPVYSISSVTSNRYGSFSMSNQTSPSSNDPLPSYQQATIDDAPPPNYYEAIKK